MDEQELASVRRATAQESEALATVRARAEQVTSPPPPEVGALLRLLAATVSVRHAVEFGAAGGVTAAWLLPGMAERGVLTSIEADTHLHSLAAAGHAECGVTDAVRSIHGDPVEMAERLSDDGYDLVLLQGNPASHTRLLSPAERLLRPGGVLVARRVASAGVNAIVEAVSGDEWSEVSVLDVDDGLLVARLAESDRSASEAAPTE